MGLLAAGAAAPRGLGLIAELASRDSAAGVMGAVAAASLPFLAYYEVSPFAFVSQAEARARSSAAVSTSEDVDPFSKVRRLLLLREPLCTSAVVAHARAAPAELC